MPNYAGYGTGRRKQAVAKVWLIPGGSGQIQINGKRPLEYLKRDRLTVVVGEPFRVTDTGDRYDAKCIVLGGGLAGQAGAVRHGIANALVDADVEYRRALGPAGLLTRDPRVKERKHAGFRKARRAKQFSKR
ncbi:MAG TPA: 30S ribosomal protein S9 [Armatimonadetes bacterium]|nr:30S ribosomal protein S9 [Armatimonadota bacterium]